jgi:hypothetical protein
VKTDHELITFVVLLHHVGGKKIVRSFFFMEVIDLVDDQIGRIQFLESEVTMESSPGIPY